MSPPVAIAHYRVVSKLGEGGMGVVYRATDTKLGRDVAIKVLPEAFAADSERLARFTREAQVLASLNHPNIATVYGVESEALVMELVPGRGLDEMVPVRDVDEAVRLAAQICDGLEAAHGKAIIHRDLKPANIRVTPDGRVKILDFGLAAFADAVPGNNSNSPTLTIAATQAGTLLGTAAYMSPEQARGRTVDKRTDIWAFGCVLYEMFTGRRAFEGDSAVDVLVAVTRAEPDWSKLPPNTPESVRRVLRDCLEKDASNRFRDAGDVRIELTRVEGAAPAPPVSRRTWIGAAGAGLGGIAAGYLVRGRAISSDADNLKPIRNYKLLLGSQRLAANLVISRDGARISYLTSEPAAPGISRRICIRELNAGSGRTIPDWRATGLVFSPDGRSLAFTTAGSLYTVSLAGGSPQKILDASGGLRDWTASGRIVCFLPNEAALCFVPAAGGAPTVIRNSLIDRRGAARVLPGERHLLVTTATGIGVMRADGSDLSIVVEGGRSPRYVSSGHVLFQHSNVWNAIPFDVGSARASGPAVALGGVVGSCTQLAIDDSGTAICGTAEAPNVAVLRRLDQRGGLLDEPTVPGTFSQLSASRDGRLLLLAANNTSTIWSYDLSRGSLARLTFEDGENESPVWSPDGKYFAYASQATATRSIMVRPVDGTSGPRTLWTTKDHIHVLDWSPDGRFLLLSGAVGSASRLSALPVDGGVPSHPWHSTGNFTDGSGSFSPDGKWIAYSSSESGRFEVYVRPWQRPGGKLTISVEGGGNPRWSRDGKQIFYQAEGRMMAVAVGEGSELSLQNPEVLFDRNFGAFDVLPDRSFVLLESPPIMGTDELDVVENFVDELRRIAPPRS